MKTGLLELYADAILSNLSLQRGQPLVILADSETLPLVEVLGARACQCGCPEVAPLLMCQKINCAMLRYAPDEAIKNLNPFMYDTIQQYMEKTHVLSTLRGAIRGRCPARIRSSSIFGTDGSRQTPKGRF